MLTAVLALAGCGSDNDTGLADGQTADLQSGDLASSDLPSGDVPSDDLADTGHDTSGSVDSDSAGDEIGDANPADSPLDSGGGTELGDSSTQTDTTAPRALSPRTAACGTAFDDSPGLSPPALDRDTLEPSTDNLMSWVTLLTDVSLSGREAGTEQSAQVARLLADRLAYFGHSNALDANAYCQSFTFSSNVQDQNVVAWYPGAVDGSSHYYIVGAHYDHLGVDDEGVHFAGADDNSSGVAVMMEVARVVASNPDAWPINILFVGFGAEERRLAGSAYMVEHPVRELADVRLMINLDMVGREFFGRDGFAYVFSDIDGERTDAVMQAADDVSGISLTGFENDAFETLGFRSDSNSFAPHTPTVFMSSSIHGDYHLVSDTPDKIVSEQITRAAVVVLEILRQHSLER